MAIYRRSTATGGAGYQAAQNPRTEDTSGSFRCVVCQTEIYALSGPYAYLDWQAVELFLPKAGRFNS